MAKSSRNLDISRSNLQGMRPRPFAGSSADIVSIANALRSAIVAQAGDDNLHGAASILKRAVHQTGGEVLISEDPHEFEIGGGSLVIRGLRNFTIFLSPFTTTLRDNFTIAHELGHYALHYVHASPRPTTPVEFTRYGTGPIEIQANRFAAEFLMPSSEFKKAFKSHRGDLHLLAGHFGVSRTAVEVRARSLGVMKEDTEG